MIEHGGYRPPGADTFRPPMGPRPNPRSPEAVAARQAQAEQQKIIEAAELARREQEQRRELRNAEREWDQLDRSEQPNGDADRIMKHGLYEKSGGQILFNRDRSGSGHDVPVYQKGVDTAFAQDVDRTLQEMGWKDSQVDVAVIAVLIDRRTKIIERLKQKGVDTKGYFELSAQDQADKEYLDRLRQEMKDEAA